LERATWVDNNCIADSSPFCSRHDLLGLNGGLGFSFPARVHTRGCEREGKPGTAEKVTRRTPGVTPIWESGPEIQDDYGGRYVRVRGAVKVMNHLMFGILALTAVRLATLST